MLKFKENLKTFRKSHRLTQSALALMLNDKLMDMNLSISYNNKSISMWEKGERLPDSPLVWLAIADLIGISVDTLMRGDINEAIKETSENIAYEKQFNAVKLSLAESYLSKVTNGTSDRESVFSLYSNFDSVNKEQGTCHGMACFVSTVKGDDGYYNHYNLLNNDDSLEYLSSLSRRSFVDEKSFVHNIILNGGSDVIATYDQIDEIWKEYFECFDNAVGYNVEILYDSDFNHILVILEYVLSVNAKEVSSYLSYELNKSIGSDDSSAIGKILLSNSKLHVGIRYAREKWKL